MIDWLQQHWPWVVLVAVAPILWAIAVPALEFSITVVGTALYLAWGLLIGIIKLPVLAFEAFVNGFQSLWRTTHRAILRKLSLPDPYLTSSPAPQETAGEVQPVRPAPKRRRRRAAASPAAPEGSREAP
jgi:hypothetical protein